MRRGTAILTELLSERGTAIFEKFCDETGRGPHNVTAVTQEEACSSEVCTVAPRAPQDSWSHNCRLDNLKTRLNVRIVHHRLQGPVLSDSSCAHDPCDACA